MADKVHEHDKQVLHKMGYAQELARRMSGFSNFAISFSIICILAGGITTFPVALSAGGGFSVAIGWFVGGLMAMSVAFGMGQIASAFPTAGGLYHWSSHLGGKAWGWATAWLNLLGLVFVVSSVDVGVYLLFKDLFLATALGVDVSSWGAVHQAVGVLLILITQGLFNHYGIELTTKLTDFSGYLIFAVAALLVIVLLVFSPVVLDFSRLTTFTNFTGDPGGGVFPFHPATGFVFLLGLLFVCYTLTGYDASAHTSEETHDAQVNVPKGMWQAVFWSWTAGLIMVCTFVLVMPSVAEGAATGWGSFYYTLDGSRMPSALLILLSAGIVVANYLCALAGLTSCSRMMYAFARDGGLPASQSLSYVSTQYRTPIYAIWTSVVVAWASTLYAPAFGVLATGCAVFLYLSMVMPIGAGVLAEGTEKWREKGPFNLGTYSKINGVIAVIVGVVLAITGFFPPNEKVFYLTVGMLVVMVILWYAFERNRFEGIPEGEKITQRQKMIAEIEKKYGEGD
jgi:amino acid transporter